MLIRILTGLALAAPLLWLILSGPFWGVPILLCIVTLLAADELLRMPPFLTRLDRLAGLVGTAALLAATFADPAFMGPAAAAGVIVALAAVLARPGDITGAAARASALVAVVGYVGLLLACALRIALLRSPALSGLPEPEFGRGAILLLLLLVFPGDTGAYFAGRALGRHKLYPLVSPKKTIEGAFGGLAGSIGGAFLARACFLPDLPISHAVGLGIAAALLEQVGDLVESLYKRAYGIKDSGALLPGHGGMLDRVDGLIFVAPMLYLYFTTLWPRALA